jgi:hypothetical protein
LTATIFSRHLRGAVGVEHDADLGVAQRHDGKEQASLALAAGSLLAAAASSIGVLIVAR